MFEQFPYTNFHELNTDWLVKIVKDFLDQYNSIQQLINSGIDDIDAETTEKIAELTAHANDLSDRLTTELETAITAFNNAATEKAIDVIATIPEDYTALSQAVADITAVMGYKYLNLTFSPGFIRAADLTVQTTSPGDHLISDAVYIPANSLVYIPKISKSMSTVLFCETDSSGNPLRMVLRGTVTSYSDGSYISVPILTAGYYRFGGNSTMSNYMNYYYRAFNSDLVFDLDNYTNWMSYPAEYETGSGPIVNGGVQSGDEYLHTTPLLLTKGMTIEYWACGSSSNIALSECSGYSYDYIQAIQASNGGGISHMKYTADHTMFVRLSARVYAPSYGFAAVLPPEIFAKWKIYNNNLHYKNVENHPLYGKHLTALGDSLISGNSLKDGPTWLTNIGIKYNMVYTNLGISGNTIAVQTAETSNPAMVNRISSIPQNTDILIIQGGANDKRLNVPIGTLDSTDTSTFMGALNVMIDNIYDRIPKAKIIFMTTYYRYSTTNSLGLGDKDYADAMIAVCENRLIPCFDNFRKSGVNFTNADQDAWMDESNNVLKMVDNVETKDDPSHHFSIEGYEWITPMYEALITAGTGF